MFRRRAAVKEAGCRMQEAGLVVSSSCRALMKDSRPLYNKAVHQQYLADGWGRVHLPDALDRKYPNAPKDWRWQWVFPQEHRLINGKTKEQGRHHTDESLVQKAVREAVAKAGLTK